MVIGASASLLALGETGWTSHVDLAQELSIVLPRFPPEMRPSAELPHP